MSCRRAFVRRIFYLESADGNDHAGRNVKRRIYFGRDDRLDNGDVVRFDVFHLESDGMDDAGFFIELVGADPAVGVAVSVMPGHKDKR